MNNYEIGINFFFNAIIIDFLTTLMNMPDMFAYILAIIFGINLGYVIVFIDPSKVHQ